MEAFTYKGITDGKYVEGDIEALNLDEASHKLKEQKIIITNLVRTSKKKKEAEKILKVWEDAGIRIEKARWGRFNVIKGTKKIELPKETDVNKLTLDKVSSFFAKKKSKKV